jgi:cell fate regulator YaaT (PSP1 superfamily)
MNETIETVQDQLPPEAPVSVEQLKLYHISFRAGLQPKASSSGIGDLAKGEIIIVQTDHGPEPALIGGGGVVLSPLDLNKPLELLPILRRASTEEVGKYHNLIQREQEARAFCQLKIKELGLAMKLLQVERYFNGSKVIFYFSSETRVDFRDLVKALVQEFRTRVEMRQIGVRHETQMLGGIGCCGRELCCGLFMKDFVPVSIKMAKEQDLPLNPAKISGVCNRLLCCLTHEYETYKALKKGMPKVGRVITFEERQYKVNYCKTLNGTVSITSLDDARDTRILTRDEWEKGASAPKGRGETEERPTPAKPGPPAPAAPRQGTGPRQGAGPRPPAPRQQAGRQAPANRQPAAGRPAVAPQQQPGAKPATTGRNQAGTPGPGKDEAGNKQGAGRSSRSRRSKGHKKGKLPS